MNNITISRFADARSLRPDPHRLEFRKFLGYKTRSSRVGVKGVDFSGVAYSPVEKKSAVQHHTIGALLIAAPCYQNTIARMGLVPFDGHTQTIPASAAAMREGCARLSCKGCEIEACLTGTSSRCSISSPRTRHTEMSFECRMRPRRRMQARGLKGRSAFRPIQVFGEMRTSCCAT